MIRFEVREHWLLQAHPLLAIGPQFLTNVGDACGDKLLITSQRTIIGRVEQLPGFGVETAD
jgi:hypothetical protein